MKLFTPRHHHPRRKKNLNPDGTSLSIVDRLQRCHHFFSNLCNEAHRDEEKKVRQAKELISSPRAVPLMFTRSHPVNNKTKK